LVRMSVPLNPYAFVLILLMDFSKESLLREVVFKTSRSGGKGGQHVNKVSSKVELNLHISSSTLFSEEQKMLLLFKLVNKINSAGFLQVVTEEERSQLLNKEKSIEKLVSLLIKALHRPKARKVSRPGKGAIEKRLNHKRATALRKINRKRNIWD
jgi:ribosome-associated protein